MTTSARRTLEPVKPRSSLYNIDPATLKSRAVDLPGMTGFPATDLFPDLPPPLHETPKEALKATIRELTVQQLNQVDLSKIQSGDSVNILTSHHGFTLHGGEAFAEMIRTVRDEVERRCGTSNIRLLAGVGLRFRECEEYIRRFQLDQYFGGKAESILPVDKGVPIQTEIGTLYGIERAYSARWIIHTHNNDIRELHLHRQMGRMLKPFAMSYATIETRSTYHQGMGPRAANLLPRMIYESPFVQDKFVCSVFLQVAPTGIVGVDAHNDLLVQDKKCAKLNLAWYGKIVTLLSKLSGVIVILDYPGPIPYTTAGGILFGNFLNATIDEFDLDLPFPPFTRYSDMLYASTTPVCGEGVLPPPNPAIKALIVNYASKGYPSTFFAQQLPTLVVGAQADLFRGCEQNARFMDYAIKVGSLAKALNFARQFGKTDHVLVFDGASGGFNVSESLAESLRKWAPEVADEVEHKLMPKWLRQRGIH
jgi:hypothetical protein